MTTHSTMSKDASATDSATAFTTNSAATFADSAATFVTNSATVLATDSAPAFATDSATAFATDSATTFDRDSANFLATDSAVTFATDSTVAAPTSATTVSADSATAIAMEGTSAMNAVATSATSASDVRVIPDVSKYKYEYLEMVVPALVSGQFADLRLKDYLPNSEAVDYDSSSSSMKKSMAILFYPADFADDTRDELAQLARKDGEFRELGCQILACSTDSVHVHLAWQNTSREEEAGRRYDAADDDAGSDESMSFPPLLGDKTLRLCRSFGVLNEASGTAQHAVIIISARGDLVYRQLVGEGDAHSKLNIEDLLRLVKAASRMYDSADPADPADPADTAQGRAGLQVAADQSEHEVKLKSRLSFATEHTFEEAEDETYIVVEEEKEDEDGEKEEEEEESAKLGRAAAEEEAADEADSGLPSKRGESAAKWDAEAEGAGLAMGAGGSAKLEEKEEEKKEEEERRAGPCETSGATTFTRLQEELRRELEAKTKERETGDDGGAAARQNMGVVGQRSTTSAAGTLRAHKKKKGCCVVM